MVLTQHPRNKDIKKILFRNFSIPTDVPRTKEIFKTTLLLRTSCNIPSPTANVSIANITHAKGAALLPKTCTHSHLMYVMGNWS